MEKNQGKLFSTNYKADPNNLCAMFITKNCLFSRMYVVSFVLEEYLLLYCLILRLTKLFEL